MHSTPLPAAEERRFLPAISDGFAIGRREPLAVGLRRVTVDQFDAALASMAQDPMNLAVHEVRKSTKRVRALLRLVRNQLGEDRYRTENAILRDTARLLAPLRDADVHVSSIEGLRDRFGAQLRSTVFADLSVRLESRRRRVFERAVDEDEWTRVVYSLRSARARYAAWPVDDEAARAHGMAVVVHGFGSVGPGLALTYRRGRQEMSEAATRPTADNFHAWRKRAKYLRHQMEMLSPLFPEVLDGYAAALGRLGEVLGDEHDLAELLRFLAANPAYVPDLTERSMLVALVQHRRAELQTAALSLGSRVYAETPNRFTGRVGDYWSAWDTPVPVGFTDQP